ncbi:phosphoribosyl-ATP diphosphatase [Kordiimonas aestuarii]|uniref:phosphoribosyl-ATP diphosphatase n=1 Tax=Kordiimonas aestuarii TaxID=1005925 RepID=UPI0021D385D1|nr:phosphoribosyl-ATP diphosphatase [Kordiimonas aestuarii]
MSDMLETLTKLEALLEERKNADPEKSYVARLYHKGAKKIAQKVGEEAVEAAMAVAGGDDKELVAESADLLFHLMVLLRAKGLSLGDVAAELARREGLSGLDEKANRSK